MLAPEGKSIVLVTAIFAIAMVIASSLLNIFVIKVLTISVIFLTFFFFYFFRNPKRSIPAGDNLILSPADGKVVYIGDVETDRTSSSLYKQISIFLSIFDVHINRVPVSGEVTFMRYKPGKFLAAFKRAASHVNEHTEIHIKVGEKVVHVKQIAGVIARRILCYLHEGDYVSAGDKLGFIRFGSRVDLIVPNTVKIHVIKGQRVKGGESIIGEFQ